VFNLKAIIENQRIFFKEGKTKEVNFRIRQLEKLKKSIIKYEDEIIDALKKDLNKSSFETYITEIGTILQEITYTIKHIRKWVRPKRVRTSIAQFISTSKIYSDPYGITLIISPWNYPFQLTMAPLIGSIAGGNCSVLKLSAYSVNASKIIDKIIGETFDEKYIKVVQGGREVNKELLNQKFDYIFFTGGVSMGKIVMEAASKHLTPVTLELGGKSPCIIDETANIDLAAKRIIWGKILNSGQTCIAPDYLLVHKSVKNQLIDKIKDYILEFYGNIPINSPDYPKIISLKHFNRLLGLIEAEDIIFGGDSNEKTNQINPTILDNITWESKVMEEEIFGPIIPILEFEDFNNIIDEINKRPKPLALYLFTTSKERENNALKNIAFGGGCINDTIMHVASTNMPFGGVGNSGMGGYHGKYTFDSFTHRKSVLKKSNLIDIPVRYPPFEGKLNLIKKIMK
jgi:aldehyde dehydrogenase (NAD+)